jgi:hypothetical protein
MLPSAETGLRAHDVVAGEGELRCTTCGYAAAVASQPDAYPMCHGTDWDAVPWRPFSREQAPASADSSGELPRIAKVA